MKIMDEICQFIGGITIGVIVVGGLLWYYDHIVVACKPRACLIYTK